MLDMLDFKVRALGYTVIPVLQFFYTYRNLLDDPGVSTVNKAKQFWHRLT